MHGCKGLFSAGFIACVTWSFMEFIFEDNRIFCEEKGKLLAEVTFPALSADMVEIDHTFVDESLRGQGVAGDLMQMAVSVMKNEGKKIKPTCTYAIAWFGKHPEHAALLAE